jgi:hypothetical protein
MTGCVVCIHSFDYGSGFCDTPYGILFIGLKGSLTSKTEVVPKKIKTAVGYIERVAELEAEFSIHPSFALIQEILDLLREAAERFEAADDSRYLEAIANIQRFLGRADVTAILDSNLSGKSHVTEKMESHTAHTDQSPINIEAPEIPAFSSDSLPPYLYPESSIGINDGKGNYSSTLDPGTGKGAPCPQAMPEDIVFNMPHGGDDDMESRWVDELIPQGPSTVDGGGVEDELSAMLGDMESEFNSIISSFGSASAHLEEENEWDLSLAEFENALKDR